MDLRSRLELLRALRWRAKWHRHAADELDRLAASLAGSWDRLDVLELESDRIAGRRGRVQPESSGEPEDPQGVRPDREWRVCLECGAVRSTDPGALAHSVLAHRGLAGWQTVTGSSRR